jgi:hypothetical protein
MITFVNNSSFLKRKSVEKNKLSLDEEVKLRKKITQKIMELKSLGASDTVIKEFLNRVERVLDNKYC